MLYILVYSSLLYCTSVYIIQRVLYLLQCTLYIVIWNVRYMIIMHSAYNMHFTLYIICTMYMLCTITLSNVHYTVYTVKAYNIHFTMNDIRYTSLYDVKYIKLVKWSAWCTIYAVTRSLPPPFSSSSSLISLTYTFISGTSVMTISRRFLDKLTSCCYSIIRVVFYWLWTVELYYLDNVLHE